MRFQQIVFAFAFFFFYKKNYLVFSSHSKKFAQKKVFLYFKVSPDTTKIEKDQQKPPTDIKNKDDQEQQVHEYPTTISGASAGYVYFF